MEVVLLFWFFLYRFSSFLGWFSKKKLLSKTYHTIPKTYFFLRTTTYKSCPLFTCTVVQILEIDNIVGYIVIDVKRGIFKLEIWLSVWIELQLNTFKFRNALFDCIEKSQTTFANDISEKVFWLKCPSHYSFPKCLIIPTIILSYYFTTTYWNVPISSHLQTKSTSLVLKGMEH